MSVIARIDNLSLQSGSMPSKRKEAVLKPLLKIQLSFVLTVLSKLQRNKERYKF